MTVLLILKGASGRGKSETLNEVIKLLRQNGLSVFYPKIKSEFQDLSDEFVILTKDDYKIGIIPFGDPGCEAPVKDAVEKCNDIDVDFIVAASRTKYSEGAVYTFLWDFAKANNYCAMETSTIVKYDGWGMPVDSHILNQICAENLLNIIDKIKQIEK